MKAIKKTFRNFIIGTIILAPTNTVFASGWPVADILAKLQLLQEYLQQVQIQINTYNQYKTMFEVENLTRGSEGMISQFTDLISEGTFGGMKSELLENFEFLSPVNQYKDLLKDGNISKDSFKTFESAKETLLEGLFTESNKTDDAVKTRQKRSDAYVNAIMNAQAHATSEKMELSKFKDKLENLQETTSKVDGVLPALIANNALTLELLEVSVRELSIQATELELQAAERLNELKTTTAFVEESKE